MSSPKTKLELKNWCLRHLGHPVIKINMDQDQLDDAVDSAFQYMREFHIDATERWYLRHQITEQDVINKYIPIPDSVESVTRIFPAGSSNANANMFDLRYQLRLHDLYDFTSTSYVGYVMTQQHIRTLDILFSGETPLRHNRHTNKLYVDWDWANEAKVGRWMVIECYVIVNPDEYNRMYNNRMLKKLAAAYVKRQWGTNMKKYSGVQLIGGIMMDGQTIYNEADAEIKELETLIRNTYEPPPEFILA